MTVKFERALGAALVFAATTQAAQADLTAQDVWSDWKSYLSSAGYAVSGDEVMSGNTLTINNMAVTMPMPEGEGEFSVSLDGLALTENSDGTVNIVMPDKVPMVFSGNVEGEDPVEGIITYSQSGQTMVASGDPSDLLYTYTAASVGLDMSSLTVAGETVPASVARVSMSMKNVASSVAMQPGDQRNYAQRMSADSLSYDFAFDDPDSEDTGTLSGALEGIGFEGQGVIPNDMDSSDFGKMLAAGFSADGVFTYMSGATNISGVGDGQPFKFTSSSQGGKAGLQMSTDKVAYTLEQKQTALSLEGAELPFPVTLDAALTAFNIAIPPVKSDTAQDFALGVNLSEFNMSDMLWSLFDPAAQLPRDPATLAVDLTGKVKVLFDFLDPDVAETLEESGEPPAELNAVTINNLLVSLVGASLSGKGDFVFDNSDVSTFGGYPRPIGQIDLKLVGGNGLLDKLISMGFVADQEAMGARMMMGMLAVPGDAPDTLNSKIEFTDQGQILANGQRIK